MLIAHHQIASSEKPLDLAKNFRLDKQQAHADLKIFTKMPHPFGSSRQKELASYLQQELTKRSIVSYLQEFSVQAPLGLTGVQKLSGQNIFAKLSETKKSSCLVLLGSHYDSKRNLEAKDILLGANDSGSSSVLLLQLISYFHELFQKGLQKKCDLAAVWFDGEESVLQNWFDSEQNHSLKLQDNTYGSRFFADQMQPCHSKLFCLKNNDSYIRSFILLDMVGSPQIRLSKETHSDQFLWQIIKKAASEMDLNHLIDPKEDILSIEDDHIPFFKKNIPVMNLIDFHHLDHWHKSSDTIEHIDFTSIEHIGQITVYLLAEQMM